MQKLINTIQHYAWGSQQALTELYGIANPDNLPMAELWMGAHPKSSSQLRDQQGNLLTLRDLIAADPAKLLGDAVARRFQELPFLFKVLCAQCPLSIQVHPDKTTAETGYARENARGIPLDAAERNYKDANHKPELVFALTPFLAMNGFRDFAGIARELQPVAAAHPAIAAFINRPQAAQLRDLFSRLLTMQGAEKAQALACLQQARQLQQGASWQAIDFIADHFPTDSGLFAPLLLNVITLQPGEAMFLYAQTPHAYLHGVALEVMANSDNVLRAGLTPKHIDIAELIASVNFSATPAASLLTQPVIQGQHTHFPVPVDDFAFSLHQLKGDTVTLSQSGPSILFCLHGEAQLSSGTQHTTLKPGQSVFISASEPKVQLSGHARLARAFTELH